MTTLTALERQTEREIEYHTQMGKFEECGFKGLDLVRAKQAYLKFRDSAQTEKDLADYERVLTELERKINLKRKITPMQTIASGDFA